MNKRGKRWVCVKRWPGGNPEWAQARREYVRGVIRDYEQLRRVSGLISQAAASRVLDVSSSYVQKLVRQGDLAWVEFPALGESGVRVDSLETYRKKRLNGGQLWRELAAEGQEQTPSNQDNKP